jgi:hypothetical protein
LITRPVIALAPVSVGIVQFIKIKKPSVKIYPDIHNHNKFVGTITFDTIEEAIEAWRCKFDCKIPGRLNFARSLRLSFVSPWNERNAKCPIGSLHNHKNEDKNLNKTYMLNASNELGIESKKIIFHIPDIFIKLDKVDNLLLGQTVERTDEDADENG